MLRTKIQTLGGRVAWVVGQSSTDIRDLTGSQWLRRFCIPVLLCKVTAIFVTVTKDSFWNYCNINRDLNDENLKCHI